MSLPEEERGPAFRADIVKLHNDAKIAIGRQSEVNEKILERLQGLSETCIKLEGRLEQGGRTFQELRDKIAELKPTPIPWTQKMAVLVGVIGLCGTAAVAIVKAPGRDDYEKLRDSIIALRIDQVRDRAAIEICKARTAP